MWNEKWKVSSEHWQIRERSEEKESVRSEQWVTINEKLITSSKKKRAVRIKEWLVKEEWAVNSEKRGMKGGEREVRREVWKEVSSGGIAVKSEQ